MVIENKLTCSGCGRPFSQADADFVPFCSKRCQQVDLGRWLDEEVQLPHETGSATAEGFEVDESGHVVDQQGE